MADKTRQRLLHYAADRFGRPELAAHLKVEPRLLESWLAGKAPMPPRKQLELADLIDSLSGGNERGHGR